MIVPILFGMACLIVLGVSYGARRMGSPADGLILALCLIGSWALTNTMGYATGDWAAVRMTHPFIDMAILTVALTLFWRHPAAWKVAIVLALLTKMGAHAAFFLLDGAWSPTHYTLLCNLIFAEELLIVFGAGGLSVGRHFLHIPGARASPDWIGATRRRLEIEARNASAATKDR